MIPALLLFAVPSALAATAQVFSPPSVSPPLSPERSVRRLTFPDLQVSPTTASKNYTGASNSTIQNGPIVKGASFDRFIQIWLENTDCEYRFQLQRRGSDELCDS